MILVTGAGGKTGCAVVAALARRGVAVRAFSRRAVAIDGAQSFVGDMTITAHWVQALVGCHQVYHICPNMHPDEVAIGRIAIQQSQQANISHFVYHSVLHPQTQAMPHHWNKLLVEELLLASGIPFSILQPTAYMQNIDLIKVQASGRLTMPYGVDSRISLVSLLDVAEAAVLVLTDKQHVGATYQLVGTEALSQREVAAILSVGFGRKIQAVEQSRDDWRVSAEKANLPLFAIETLCAMFNYYDQHGLVGNANTLRWLLSKPPTSLNAHIADFIKSSV